MVSCFRDWLGRAKYDSPLMELPLACLVFMIVDTKLALLVATYCVFAVKFYKIEIK